MASSLSTCLAEKHSCRSSAALFAVLRLLEAEIDACLSVEIAVHLWIERRLKALQLEPGNTPDMQMGVPVKGGGLKEGIEVFPRQDRLDDGEYGNAIRAPLGVHRKTNRRYWFYEAEPTPEAQLAYVEGVKKLTEAELRIFIEGMSLPEAYTPVVALPYTPPASSHRYPEFRILDYVRTTRKDSRNWWARCPIDQETTVKIEGFRRILGDPIYGEILWRIAHARQANAVPNAQMQACVAEAMERASRGFRKVQTLSDQIGETRFIAILDRLRVESTMTIPKLEVLKTLVAELEREAARSAA